jgi:hypothetical protein
MNNNKGNSMKKSLQWGLILAGFVALSLSMANATCGSGKEAPKTMKKCESGKCAAGKCGEAGMKSAMKKEMNATKPSVETKAPAKGKCGVGKCG